jgi:transposase
MDERNGSSALFGLSDVVVDSVVVHADGSRTVRIRTAPDWVGLCPGCGARSTRSKERVTTRPRDIRIGPDCPAVVWEKRKWLCTNVLCARKGFTESVPGIRAGRRISERARHEMALAVLDDDRSVKAVAAEYGCSWNTCHAAVVVVADTVLAGEPGPVVVVGIDETRRGKPKWETCPLTGTRSWVDRWDTGVVDISGSQGLLGQVNGRAAKPVADWLTARDPDWKAGIRFVAIDMSVVYAKAARDALPDAQLLVDRFHLVKRANEMVDAVRRRTTQAYRGRRDHRSGMDQPPPAAPRRGTTDRRTTGEALRSAHHRGPGR